LPRLDLPSCQIPTRETKKRGEGRDSNDAGGRKISYRGKDAGNVDHWLGSYRLDGEKERKAGFLEGPEGTD